MKKWLTLTFLVSTIYCLMTIIQLPTATASSLSDGTYVVEYEMLQADNDSVSIANDYFEKPAILTVDGETQYIQFTVNRSEWVKVLAAADGDSFVDVDVVSENPETDQRVIAFKVDGDISEPVLMHMHIVIKDMEPAYDHKYSVRLNFDQKTIRETDAPAIIVPSSESKTEEKTGNNVIIYTLIAVLAVAIVIIARKFSSSKNKPQLEERNK